MVGLWADGWFYISSAGLLVSGVLFIFLLGQYRIASEAADIAEMETGSEKDAQASAIRPVYTPEAAAAPKVVSHADTTGGLSPTVVYLQNIKTELAELHKEMNELAKRVDDRLAEGSSRDEALIERLGELASALESMKAAAPAPAPAAAPAPEQPAPSPKKARKAEKAPEPEPEPLPEAVPEPKAELDSVLAELAAVTLAPAPEPAPALAPIIELFPEPVKKQSETARRADETTRVDLSALVAPEPEAPPEEKPRRGPVWPV